MTKKVIRHFRRQNRTLFLKSHSKILVCEIIFRPPPTRRQVSVCGYLNVRMDIARYIGLQGTGMTG